MAARPVITLLTDFGTSDHYVAAMKGVMLGICRDAQLVDVSHEVARYGIREAAYTLAQCWTFFPRGTVHLVVVDPGVGSARRPIAAAAGEHLFVAPDNGVLSMIYDAAPGCEVREITAAEYFRSPVSRTFHGRDIFSPVAAHLAAGVPIGQMGQKIEDFRRFDSAKSAAAGDGRWSGAVLKIDRFGNVITDFRSEEFPLDAGNWEIRVGTTRVNHTAQNYADAPAGTLFLIGGSSGYVEISMREASAAEVLACRVGDEMTMYRKA